jgi:hypothetical protein
VDDSCNSAAAARHARTRAVQRGRHGEVLPGLLTCEIGYLEPERLGKVVAGLAATAQEREQGRKALLAMLTHETKPEAAQQLAAVVARLSPAVADLGEPDTWLVRQHTNRWLPD